MVENSAPRNWDWHEWEIRNPKLARGHYFFMEVENNAAAYHDWILVEGKSKEYAEKIFGMEFAD